LKIFQFWKEEAQAQEGATTTVGSMLGGKICTAESMSNYTGEHIREEQISTVRSSTED
jgi:hypothetical protein